MDLLLTIIYSTIVIFSLNAGRFVSEKTREELKGKYHFLSAFELLLTAAVSVILLVNAKLITTLYFIPGFIFFWLFGYTIRDLKYAFPFLSGMTIAVMGSPQITGLFAVIFYLSGSKIGKNKAIKQSAIVLASAVGFAFAMSYFSAESSFLAALSGSLLGIKISDGSVVFKPDN